ncbi:MAG: secondary thiamine-phosphate synthase enzyme YjbQ [Candidatus Omnitrophica bacterium]|nr:secondary thiamine-phosphate synthase enzyme YjbQ [Candidatus Omnitrophota bacterium]MBU1923108.1 secondary thiamine-phosphate synthase enzyme YjbQ [Candidatus Omnitrophota bacterium]
MKVINEKIVLSTKGNPDLIDITDKVADILASSGLKKGNVTIFVVGSTAAITTFEYESGLISDMRDLYEKLIPQNKHYNHDETWGDANGFSHLRAALQGPSLTIPFENAKLMLGTWQQIVLAEFDNRPRKREVIVQIMGE